MGGPSARRLGIPASPDEARAIQERVAREVDAAPPVTLGGVRSLAGADAAYSPDGRTVHAAIALFTFPGLDVLERSRVTRETSYPYLPGFFAFREGPAIIAAVGALTHRPDLILVDGHGRAHPRRAGIACHVGACLGIPAIGVAKRILVGEAGEVGEARGSATPIRDGDEVIGMAVRTRAGSRPVYVSVGYAIGLEDAVEVVLSASPASRIPVPIGEAHRIAREGLPDPPPAARQS